MDKNWVELGKLVVVPSEKLQWPTHISKVKCLMIVLELERETATQAVESALEESIVEMRV